jgi:hypothetical protein
MKALGFAVILGFVAVTGSAAPPGIAPKATPIAPPPASWNAWVSMFRDYMDLIDHFARVSQDPSTSGVAAVIYTDDILRTKPPQEAIDYYQKLLPDVKDPAIARAIRLRLAEHYRLSNQGDHALEQLRLLMTAAPSSSSSAPAPQSR